MDVFLHNCFIYNEERNYLIPYNVFKCQFFVMSLVIILNLAPITSLNNKPVKTKTEKSKNKVL